MRREVVVAALVAVPVLFLADGVNRAQFTRILKNMSGGKPPMEKVAFVFPLVPHPTPTPTTAPLYPDSVLFGEDVILKYEDLGTGYWQTGGFNMVSGEPTSGEEDWQSHFRFKFNPPDDPLHPGHSVVAIPGGRSTVRFAKLGKADFFGFTDVGRARWIAVAGAETPAVWGLVAGETVAMRIETDLSIPLQTAKRPEPEGTPLLGKPKGSPTPPPPMIKVQKLTYAKIFVRKVSHDTVRFDYVYQTDGKPRFPTPHPMAEFGI